MAFLADAVCSKWHFWAIFLALLLPILLAALFGLSTEELVASLQIIQNTCLSPYRGKVGH